MDQFEFMLGGDESERWVSAHPQGIVRDAQEKAAGAIGGFVNRPIGSVVFTTALMSQDAAGCIAEMAAEEDSGRMELLMEAWPDVSWADTYKLEHKLVADSTGRPVVVKRIPGLSTEAMASMGAEGEDAVREYDKLSGERVARAEVRAARKDRDRPTKVCDLASFFCDDDTIARYSVPAAFMALVKRGAVVDAVNAASVLQSFLRKRGFDVEVKPGKYAAGARAARASLLAAAGPYLSATVVPQCTIVGSEIYFEEGEPGAMRGWHVKGSLRHADVVRAVAVLVMVRGAAAVSTLFTDPLFKAGIEVVSRGDLYGMPDRHAGDGGDTDYGEVTEKSQEIKRWVSPVLSPAGALMGTALRLSGGTSAVNAHVISKASDAGGGYLGGEALNVLSEYTVDAVLVSHGPGVGGVPFTRVTFHRRARVGEKCKLYCAVADGTCVEVSEVQVLASESGVVVSSLARGAGPGCSGGVLVSEDDGALIGLYHGSTAWESMFVPASEFLGARATAQPAVGQVVHENSSADTYKGLLARGLEKQVQVLGSALVGLTVDEKIVGTGLSTWSGVISTLDDSLWPLRFVDGTVCQNVGTRGCKQVYQPHGDMYTGKARAPRLGEAVCLMMRDSDGDAQLTGTTTVRVQPRDGICYVGCVPEHDKLLLHGAVVMALSDAAVVGVVHEVCDGHFGRMIRVATVDHTEVVAREAVRSALPRLCDWSVSAVGVGECHRFLTDAVYRRRAVELGKTFLAERADAGGGQIIPMVVARKVKSALADQRHLQRVVSPEELIIGYVGLVGRVRGHEAAELLVANVKAAGLVAPRPRTWSGFETIFDSDENSSPLTGDSGG